MTNEFQLPHGQAGAKIPFDLLTPDQVRLIVACADRASKIVIEFLKQRGNAGDALLERDMMILRMDIACACLSRNLDLFAWLMSDDLSFFDEWVTLQKFLDRTSGRIPGDVKMRFAQSGAKSVILTH